MASSNTEIANMAISHLGVGVDIADLDTEDSQEAIACRRFYEPARKATLRDFPWPFATAFADLALVETTPDEIDEEWAYSHRYPSSCLKIRRIVSGVLPETRQSRIPYQEARDSTGKLIYSNYLTPRVEFTYDESTVSRFDDDFVLAFSLRLAAYVAPRLTSGDPFKLGLRALQLYMSHVGMAQATAVNEQQDREEPESEFIRARD